MKIKSIISLLLVMVLLLPLSGCGTTVKEEDYLNFPGLRWGMTQDEVIEALGLSDGSYTYVDNEGEKRIVVDALPCFGAETEAIAFCFSNVYLAEDDFYLYYILIKYTDETNMNAVRTSIEEIYGTPTDDDYPVSKGNTSEGHLVYWASSKSLNTAFTSKQLRRFQAINPDADLSEILQAPLASIKWTDDAAWLYGSQNKPHETYPNHKMIIMVGSNAAIYDLINKNS